MNNNIIYTPYLYRIGWSKTDIHYIGVEYKPTAHPDNLWSKYFTSSKYVKEYREENGEPDIIEVRKTFITAEEALCYENKILNKVNARKNDRFLNACNGGINFSDNTGKVTVKDRDGNTMRVSTNDLRYLSGDLVHVNVGKLTVKDRNGDTLQVSVNDPRYLSGELVHMHKGMVVVKDRNGNNLLVSVNDPKYLSGEYTHVSKGLVSCKRLNDTSGEIISVPKAMFDNDPNLVGVSHGIKASYIPTEEHRKINSEYMKNHIVTDETKNKMSAKKKGLVSCKNKHDETNTVIKVPRDVFQANPDLVGLNYKRKVSEEEKQRLRNRKKGMVMCKNKHTNEELHVTKEEFASNPNLVR